MDRGLVETEVFCMAEGRLTERLAACDVPYSLVPRPRGIGLRAARAVARLADERGVDILHSHTARTNLLGRLAARRCAARHVATIQSPVRLDINDAGAPRPRDDCEYEGGMAVCVGNVDAGDECFDVAFCLVVNNVARGAWGAALLNAEYWAWLEKEARKGGGERR